jgi:methionine-rich copper-binding protein CopC
MEHKKNMTWPCVRTLSLLASLALPFPADAAGVRDFTRSAPPAGTAVTSAQASELTLTLTEAATRPIQNWIRTAGRLAPSGRVLTTFLRAPESDLVKIGQRFQAYTVNTRTRMHLGYITKITPQAGGATIEGTLPIQASNDIPSYLMEIVVERGPYLSIPNVSIIEENGDHVVYIQKQPGQYTPLVIKTGLQGELYTQVTEGLNEGDQVVSIGSFFVDAETKLKSPAVMMAAMPGMDHGSMPGMDHSQMAASAPPANAGTVPAMVMSEPAANATVKGPLPMIHVMFNGPVDPKASSFEVTKKDGTRIDVGEAMPMGATMLMAMPKAPLPAGAYRVKWRTVAASKTLEGEFSFSVQ